METKVLINTTYGAFSLSEEVVEKALEKGLNDDHFLGSEDGKFYTDPLEMEEFEFRSDERLIQAAEEVSEDGGLISGSPPKYQDHPTRDPEDRVEIVTVTVDLYISDYDGKESIKAGSVRQLKGK